MYRGNFGQVFRTVRIPETGERALQLVYLATPDTEVRAAPARKKLADVEAAGEGNPPVHGEDLAVRTMQVPRVDRTQRATERAEPERVYPVRKLLERLGLAEVSELVEDGVDADTFPRLPGQDVYKAAPYLIVEPHKSFYKDMIFSLLDLGEHIFVEPAVVRVELYVLVAGFQLYLGLLFPGEAFFRRLFPKFAPDRLEGFYSHQDYRL